MLVTINPNYKGAYGHYIPELGTVALKKAGCEPFDEDSEIAHKQIKNGVMVAVDPATVPVPTVEEAPKPVATSQREPVDDTVDDLVDDLVDEANGDDNLDDLSIAELRAAAKERGISSFGVKKTALIEMIREYDSKDAPDLGAIDPV